MTKLDESLLQHHSGAEPSVKYADTVSMTTLPNPGIMPSYLKFQDMYAADSVRASLVPARVQFVKKDSMVTGMSKGWKLTKFMSIRLCSNTL